MCEKLKIKSKSFENGGWIPNRHSGYGEDISPEFIIEGIVSEAVSMVIILDDMSHPLFPNYNHWIAWNIPPVSIIPEGIPKGDIIERPIHIEQGMAYGKHCYRGPKPPFSWNHNYRFTVYILDKKLIISTNSRKEDVLKAIEGHILQRGILIGKYQRKHKKEAYD